MLASSSAELLFWEWGSPLGFLMNSLVPRRMEKCPRLSFVIADCTSIKPPGCSIIARFLASGSLPSAGRCLVTPVDVRLVEGEDGTK